ncbi:MAG TPA: SRPBCC domain-containing protein [Dehalococcoidia bacterium]|jgi:uncharacterized protein YndB with AHSA1/START domain|nr:SRPBCC domain-containing protein [Dehalococcoidia bacterium]
MQRLQFAIQIQAPREKVWKTMLEDETYRQWTEPFSPGSYYVGDWAEGSKVLFLGPGEGGKEEGMVSRIKANRPYEYVSIEHLGFVQNGVEDTTSENVKPWVGAEENYTLKQSDGGTELLIELDTAPEQREMFEDMWPRALEKLKQISER